MLSAVNKSKKNSLWPAAAAAPVAEDTQWNSCDVDDEAMYINSEI